MDTPLEALLIMRKMVSAEGFNIPKSLLERELVKQLSQGKILVWHKEQTVFTVGTDPEYPVVHLYADNAGPRLMRHTRDFMGEVWGMVTHQKLVAPILKPGVKSLARRVGWESTQLFYPTGHELFYIERSKK